MSDRSDFERDLATVINKHSRENDSDTPDFILAEFLLRCLEGFELTSNRREEWYGGNLEPGRAGSPWRTKSPPADAGTTQGD